MSKFKITPELDHVLRAALKRSTRLQYYLEPAKLRDGGTKVIGDGGGGC